MSVLPDELSTIQKRVDALKNKPAKPEKPKPSRPFPRKGSKFIDGVYYAPEDVERLGLSSGNKSRNNGGKSEPARTRASLQGNKRVSSAAAPELDRRDTRHSGSGESQPTDHERSDADYDEPIRDGRKTESAASDRHPRLDSGDNSAEGIAARVSKGASRIAGGAFEWMAGLGKPGEDNESGPSSGNGFHPVEHVANFLDEEYAQPFTEHEATEREQEVIDMIVGYSADIDDFLTLSNAEGAVSTFWAMDKDEAAPLARIWLKRAKRDKRAAATLRLALQGDDYKRAAIVMFPRVIQSATWHGKHGGFRMQPWENRNRES